MIEHVRQALDESRRALQDLIGQPETLERIARAGELLARSLGGASRVFSCGNGGSMCDAIHFAEELSGRFRRDRRGLPAIAIADPGHLSCVANDFGYAFVFSRFLEAHARPGDVLVGISTSGSSANVIEGARHARDHGVHVVALTGRRDSALGRLATIDICTPAGAFADRVQELHIKVIHILIELVERELFPGNYLDRSPK